jgi:2-C-methyl-D-erythritol 2,4-cyclodiphosphate synthase
VRVGIGFDVHRFDDARLLVLGGVTIGGARGLAGHSDADVLCHAIADAVLGAASLGDIGEHFPPGDPKWKDASGLLLLERVREMAQAAGYTVGSVDAVVVLAEPKISPFRDAMKANIGAALDLSPDAVGVKATTTDGLGAIGRGEGAACTAVALVEDARAGS